MLVTNELNPDPRVEREAMSLTSRGYRVRILGLSLSDAPVEPRDMRGIDLRLVMPTRSIGTPVRSGWKGALFKILRFNSGAIRMAPQILQGVAVIHAHDFDTLPAAMILSRMSGAKLVYDAHESYSEMFASSVPKFIGIFVDALEKLLAKRADLIITSGEMLGRRIEKVTGRKPLVLRNTVFRSFSEGIQRKEPRQFTIGYVGGLLPDRNIEQLVSAFQSFNRRHTDSKLVVAGWGPLSGFVERAAAASPAQSIQYLGKVPYDQVPRILSGLSIAVVFGGRGSTNNKYANPNKLFEAASLGVPVLASDFGEMAWTVLSRKLGFVVNSEKPEAIETVMERLYSNQQELRSLGDLAKQTFEKDLSWDSIQGALVEHYETLLRSEN